MIASLSGIRGILNKDITLEDVSRFATNFADASGSEEFLLARDTRRTGPMMARAVAAGLLSRGARVFDFGVISTPALFRESRKRNRPAVMVTASHNEPEFNGLKFIDDGLGIGQEVFEEVMNDGAVEKNQYPSGSVRGMPRSSYVDDLVERFGEGSCEGVRVALDLGGGAAISHSMPLLRRLGCEVRSVNDSYGVFSREVDPVADELTLLRRMVKQERCQTGLGFDCDGDRLVIVDSEGRKRTGDFMLTLALSEMLAESKEKRVVISLDSTQAVDKVAKRTGAEVFRSKVGEANVVAMMRAKGSRLGGEGSSGGLIDGAFNYCRDSMLAALVIVRALKRQGTKFYDSVPKYHLQRVTVPITKSKAEKAFRTIAKKYKDADQTDGVKVPLSKESWVLLRRSGTEDLVRVSAEAPSAAKAAQIAKSFSSKLRELSR